MTRQSLFEDSPSTIYDLKLKCKLVPLKYEDIVFSPLSQLLCQNCGMFGRTYRCPPYTRKYYKTKEYLKQFDNFLFILTESKSEDYERRYNGMKSKFKLSEYRLQNLVGTQLNAENIGNTRDNFKTVLRFIRSRYEKFEAYEVGGGCQRCKPCKKQLKQPCCHPYESFASPEGSGIDVYSTLKKIGVEIETPPIKKYISVAMFCWKS